MTKRIWEIDLLRAIAIVLMTVFHFVYDLNEFAGVDVEYLRGFWFYVGRAAALLFIFVAGISCGFSSRNIRRGLKLLAIGMGITLVTYVAVGDGYIRYGVLHFLGTCMLLFPLLARLKVWQLGALALMVWYLTDTVATVTVNTGLLLPLGLRYRGFWSVDYFPLIPWLAVFLLGMMCYKLHYHRGRSLFPFCLENRYITALSRNSLLIYVLHQPVLVGGILLYQLVIG